MDWIFDNIQILIAIGAAVAFWLNKAREERETRRQMEENDEPVDWEDEVFGPREEEALAPPPPPRIVIHQRTPPPLPPQADAEVQRQREMMERLKTLRAERAQAAAKKTAARAAAPAALAGLRSRLRDKGEIRRAVVLREILGPPVGLK